MVLKAKIVPQITLVGAGPGDPELITLKGIKALQAANVVLYDALASQDLLNYCEPNTELIFVGKRAGVPCVSQEYISQIMVEKAIEKGHVVRLKGGDPMVFGRALEEIEKAREYGIDPLVIPGISSSIAAGTSLGVPVTARGYADSFWVITGTKSDLELSTDVQLAAQSKATVILLMAMSKLEQIQEIYINAGRGDLPFLLVQNATTEFQKEAVGTMQNIVEIKEKSGLQNPAVLIIGEVAALAQIKNNKNSYQQFASTILV